MATQTLISEAEYLSTPYESPTPDYVEGVVVERTMPNNEHSRTQAQLITALHPIPHLYLRPELRVRVAATQYRIADLIVYADTEPTDLVPEQIPLVVIEIVSPDDFHEDVMTKLAAYESWGVPNVWLVDPGLRRFSVYHEGSLTAVPFFHLPERGLRIELGAILR